MRRCWSTQRLAHGGRGGHGAHGAVDLGGADGVGHVHRRRWTRGAAPGRPPRARTRCRSVRAIAPERRARRRARRRLAGRCQAMARYMAPVSRQEKPSSLATAFATVDLPAPRGPVDGDDHHCTSLFDVGKETGIAHATARRNPSPITGTLPAGAHKRPGHGQTVVAVRVEARGPRAPAGRAGPPRNRSSPSSQASTPRSARPSMMAARRSVSFTRSSPTSRNTVTPRACAATSASTGISSMIDGDLAREAPRSRAGSGVKHTAMVPQGSLPSRPP